MAAGMSQMTVHHYDLVAKHEARPEPIAPILPMSYTVRQGGNSTLAPPHLTLSS